MVIQQPIVLAREFMASANNEEDTDVEEAMAQLTLELMQATFEKPEEGEHRHLKPLFLKGHVDRRPMTKMTVDGGADINLMPNTIFVKLA